ncbi:MAG: hypothetical protein L0Y72_11240 [Gemmataceae bacterium]|nr:hypothetical protein [Gemmataceae bacterium]MCI0739611.1 hypothetical protein [Gemmataceae bacterium]
MSKQLMEVVLPRLARPLYRQLERLQTGKMNELQFSAKLERILQRQHAWLARQGISAARAAIALHAAVLVLSQPGLRSEAADAGVPLEIVERRAIQEAASYVAADYQLPPGRIAQAIGFLVAKYGD